MKDLQEQKAREVTNTQAGSTMATINEIVLSNEAAKEAVMRSIKDIQKEFTFMALDFTGDENDRRSLGTEEVFEEIARLSKMSAEELEPILNSVNLRTQCR